jgi:hypothetical protein
LSATWGHLHSSGGERDGERNSPAAIFDSYKNWRIKGLSNLSENQDGNNLFESIHSGGLMRLFFLFPGVFKGLPLFLRPAFILNY